MKKARKIIGLTGLIVFAVVITVYTPALENDFVNWDDGSYVYENPHIQFLDSQSMYWMLTSFDAANWHPLTWLSHALDYRFWKLNPWGHHLTSIVLHAINSLLVFFLAVALMLGVKSSKEMQPRSSLQTPLIVAAVTSLLFGLHPLRVESVAWISERKDLLCAFFSLLSILAYLTFTSSAVKLYRVLWFIISLVLMLCALLSKPMAITFPIILLLLDIYPLKRLKTPFTNTLVLLEKIPFIVLSVLSGIITIQAQRSGEALRSFEQFSFGSRLLIAIKSLVFYLEKTLLPFDLAPFYPLPKLIDLPDWRYITPIILVLSITGFCMWLAKKGNHLFFIVWSYYVITLLPVLGIIQVGHQSAADRYTYLPLLSMYLLAGIGVAWFFKKYGWLHQKIISGVLLLIISFIFVCLGVLTIKQIRIWHNSESLWTHEISIFPKSVSFPYSSLGNAYLDNGLADEALDAYKKGLAIEPRDPMAHNNLGVAYEKKGMLDEAISKYKDAINVDANYDLPHYNLGNVYNVKGMHEQSILEYKKALAINPDLASTHNNLGQIYAKKSLFVEAILEYQRALSINPRYTEAYDNLGTVYLNKGMANEAITQFKKAIALNPNDAKVHCNLGAAYSKNKMLDEAIAECEKAIALDPKYAKAYFNLGSAYGSKGMMDEAIANFKQVITIEPGYAKAHYNLALVYYSQGNYKLSLEYLDRAKELGTRVDPKIDELLQAYR